VIRIVVDGSPVGKGRPRFVRSVGRAFTPAKTANYEAILAAAGGDVMGRQAPLEGPLRVIVTAFMPLAASWSKKKTAAALEGLIRPGKPDADNILKVLDALNGIVWRDDSQIAEARISKLYDPDPRLEIEVAQL
jgi:Holliday junction resolvase RusA-like endonuclease